MAGRGVLIDFKSYVDAKGITYKPFSRFRIGISDVEADANYQGVTFEPGDIRIIPFGIPEKLGKKTGEEQAAAPDRYSMCGLEGSMEMARWLWNQHFAAVASDNIAVESYPSVINGELQPLSKLFLHQWFLNLFDMPLGEMWYLGELAEKCKASQEYTFFLTSSPLNVFALVASPPNALATL